MTQKLLDRADVVAIFKQVRGKRMAERVRGCRLGYPGLANGLFHSFLQHGFVQVMSVFFSGCPICVVARCRKYPLPAPFFSRIGIFAIEGVRQDDSAQAALKIALVLLSNDFEVLSEGFFHPKNVS